jgi:hypothetical protein
MNILLTAAILTAFTVPDMDTDFKSYMDYRCITDTHSRQYRLQQAAETDENGLRVYKNRYMVAVGTYYGEVGDNLVVTLDTGVTFDAVIGDIKADCTTDKTHRYHPMRDGNGNVVEFIVDIRELPKAVRWSGTVSSIEEFEGNIEKIERAD